MVGVSKAEVLGRSGAVGLLALTACLVRFDSQTNVFFSSVRETATFTSLHSLQILVYVGWGGAIYNVVQLIRCVILHIRDKERRRYYNNAQLLCASFLLDQVGAYAVFSCNSAAMAGSVMAVTGSKEFEWSKECSKFRSFCIQIAASVLCGYAASFLFVILASLSAFNYFNSQTQNKNSPHPRPTPTLATA